jgi:glycosyltransferase involved in cell wall biosynthesis
MLLANRLADSQFITDVSLGVLRSGGPYEHLLRSSVSLVSFDNRLSASSTLGALRSSRLIAHHILPSPPDVVCAFTAPACQAAACALLFVPESAKPTLLTTIRNCHSEKLQSPALKHRATARLSEQFYRVSDHIIALSQGVAEDLSTHACIPRHKISVIYNGVETPRVSRTPASALHADHPPILACGRLVPQKGFDILLHAFASLLPHLQNTTGTAPRLVILGEGPERGRLERLAHSLGVNESVEMPGWVQNPEDYMSVCSVFVLPSRYEGLGSVLLEAMSAGCPIIATDCRYGPSEILRGGADGVLVEPERHDLLAESMARVLADSRLRARLKHAAERRSTSFSMAAAASKYEDVFFQAMQQPGSEA